MQELMMGRRRGGLKGELALALPATLTMLAVIFLIEGVTRQRLLFASLASSAFLIYYEPMHRMNAAGVMALSQILGFGLGIGASVLLGPGYAAGSIAMTATILMLIVLNIVHPPAVSTALAFAFIPAKERTVLLFVVAVVLITLLVILQRTAVWTVRRFEMYVEEGKEWVLHHEPGHHSDP